MSGQGPSGQGPSGRGVRSPLRRAPRRHRYRTDRTYRTGRYEAYRRAACFFRAGLLAYLGLWSLLAALVGLYADSLAVIFGASPLFFALFAFAFRELERIEQ